MNRRAFIKVASLLSVASSISSTAQDPKVDPAALKQFQEILGYPDEQFNRFLQNPANQKILSRIGDIAKTNILFEVLKKTL